jgi:hypothetical protein
MHLLAIHGRKCSTPSQPWPKTQNLDLLRARKIRDSRQEEKVNCFRRSKSIPFAPSVLTASLDPSKRLDPDCGLPRTVGRGIRKEDVALRIDARDILLSVALESSTSPGRIESTSGHRSAASMIIGRVNQSAWSAEAITTRSCPLCVVTSVSV